MKNAIICTYIVEVNESGVKKFLKLYETEVFFYLEKVEKGFQIIKRIKREKAFELINNTI
ncbi:hypothetical protein [Chryseobacterium sp.]|uniref:hypothetical protein n=1 Tax=Chryseobacterium sp. TaxID=1871047 RepID=UPI002899B86E|nr:hypothetical protein [Chryseobacterium sp.]